MIDDLNSITKKMASACAKREHCRMEISQKLKKWKLPADEVEKILSTLVNNSYIDEKRYAQAFSRDKYQLQYWGRNKIKNELATRQISQSNINEGLKEIDDDIYFEMVRQQIAKKIKTINEKDATRKKHKLFYFAASRGYELEIVLKIWDSLNTI